MTLATLRKLEWAGDSSGWSCCPCCEALQGRPVGTPHAPDCELDAAIREQAETGERPEILPGDWLVDSAGRHYSTPADVVMIKRGDAMRVLWRQEPPTHD